jgi:hypothetical protein
VDELRARAAGWRTASFTPSAGDSIHLRPVGSFDGSLRAYRRWGLCAWAYGAPALTVVLGAIRRSVRAPHTGGAHYLWGWLSGALRRHPRADRATLAFARVEERARIRSTLYSAIGRSRIKVRLRV